MEAGRKGRSVVASVILVIEIPGDGVRKHGDGKTSRRIKVSLKMDICVYEPGGENTK